MPYFGTIVRGIHESTPASDAGLRVTINKICALHIDEFMAIEELLSIAIDSSEFGLRMFFEVLKAKPITKEAFEDEKSHADKALGDKESVVVKAKERAKELAKDLSASRNNLAAERTRLSESEQSLKTVTEILTAAHDRLAKSEEQQRRIQLRATTAETNLNASRDTVRSLQRSQQQEQSRANQL